MATVERGRAAVEPARRRSTSDRRASGIFAALDATEHALDRRAGRRRGRREPDAHARRSTPSPLEDAGAARRSTACGRTWSPTAATSSCSGSRTASRGCGWRARATAARRRRSTLELAIEAALEERAPDLLGHRRRGRRRARRGARSRAPDAEWVELDGVAGPGARRMIAGGRGLVVANVAGTLLAYRDRCAGCAAPLTERDARSAASSPARAAGRVRPAARRAAARTTTRCSSSPCRCCATAGRCGSRCRRARAGGADRRRASCARSGSARTTATCCTSSSGASSASARRAGRCTRATRSTARPACADAVLDDFAMTDDVWAAFQIPIGLSFLLRSSVERVGRRALPEPGRRDGVRARADGVGRAVRRPTRCSTASSPTPRR